MLHGVPKLGERFLSLCPSFDVAGLWNPNQEPGVAGRFWDYNDRIKGDDMNENKFLDLGLIIKAADIQGDGRFTGYASTFGGDPDSYGDIIAPGAFQASLNANGYGGNGVKMLWQHDTDDPIGMWTVLREDAKGLYVEGQLVLEVQKAKEAYALLKVGAVNTMSIGFRIKAFSEDRDKGVRVLEEIELYEISLVTFPANVSATITSVKTATKQEVETAMRDAREFESLLRDAKGLSREAAKMVVSFCKAGQCRERDASISTLVQAIKAETDKLRGNCGTPKISR